MKLASIIKIKFWHINVLRMPSNKGCSPYNAFLHGSPGQPVFLSILFSTPFLLSILHSPKAGSAAHFKSIPGTLRNCLLINCSSLPRSVCVLGVPPSPLAVKFHKGTKYICLSNTRTLESSSDKSEYKSC